jgi:DNA polymerase zeta
MRNIVIPLGGEGASKTHLKKTLESYMKSSSCIVCRAKLTPSPPALPGVEPTAFELLPLCQRCSRRPARSLLALKDRIWKSETKVQAVDTVCRSCSKLAPGDEIKCDSRDCPVFYTRIKEKSRLKALREGVGRVVDVMEEHAEEGMVALEYKERSVSIESEDLVW